MEIAKMLTISTAHVSPDTIKDLDRVSSHTLSTDLLSCNIPFAVYRKSEYGYFVYITEESMDRAIIGELCPRDLLKAAIFAGEHECNILCLDRDGEILPELTDYSELY